MYNASCLCGKIIFKIKNIVGDYVYCHCRSCRKSSGSAFGANVSVPLGDFEVVAGEQLIRVYESTPGKRRHFCGHCGTPLFTKVGDNASVVRLRLGCLDSNYMKTTRAHIFTGDKASWENIDDDVPQFKKWPSTDVVKIYGSHQPKQ